MTTKKKTDHPIEIADASNRAAQLVGDGIAKLGALARHDELIVTAPGTAPALAGALTEKAQTQLATAERVAQVHAELVDAHGLLATALAELHQLADDDDSDV